MRPLENEHGNANTVITHITNIGQVLLRLLFSWLNWNFVEHTGIDSVRAFHIICRPDRRS